MGYVDFKGSSGPSNATLRDATNKITGATGSGGYHGAPLVNIAFPGASLSAPSSANGFPTIPWYAWSAVAALAAWWIWKRRK